jgi:hypothetical protein
MRDEENYGRMGNSDIHQFLSEPAISGAPEAMRVRSGAKIDGCPSPPTHRFEILRGREFLLQR